MTDTLSQLRAGKLTGATRLELACGLTSFPREIFDLADSLEVLSLTNNRLSALPDDLGRLHKLRILFCSSNDFTHLPAVLGECESLSMIGFKSNRIESINDGAFPPALRWLILTDNLIRHLPPSIGRCARLQKLMLAGNQLDSLPDEMAACENLELIRLAANQLRALPDWLLSLPRLSWLALAGNPCANPMENHAGVMTEIDWSKLQLQEQLGEGASGVIHRAMWQTATEVARPVAVKVFKGAVTSDGLPASEMAASFAAGTHPNLIEVLGRVVNHPEQSDGLVMSLIDPEFSTLAGPPDFDTCTRDLYGVDPRFELPVLLGIARGVASAATRLHAQGILHGDLYAHNVQWHDDRRCLLGDFGAATFYSAMDNRTSAALQRIEVRAFGHLLEELLDRAITEPEQMPVMDRLRALQARCVTPVVSARLSFAQIEMELRD